MNNLLKRVHDTFVTGIEIKQNALDFLPEKIVQAAGVMIECLDSGNKVLACGNGGSASDAQHFVAELVNRFLVERAPLAAIALNTDTSVLTAIANDYEYSQIFSKQVQALGKEKDVLLAISTSGNSHNIVEAVEAAHQNGLRVIALTGNDGGEIGAMLDDYDVEIRVLHDCPPRIQEMHIVVIHCLCDLIEQYVFADEINEEIIIEE